MAYNILLTYFIQVSIYATDKSMDGIVIISPGSAFIKRDQLDPWIKDQLRNALLSTILSLQ